MYGQGDRIVKGDNKRAIVMERMPDEAVDKGFKLGVRFGGEQLPTIYQSYTTTGVAYDEFHAPEHVDDFELYS
ncbi:MAG TPA: hypothetical protein VGM37_11510 [Armatimonadota bacterium]|jgi:hypothetical protein